MQQPAAQPDPFSNPAPASSGDPFFQDETPSNPVQNQTSDPFDNKITEAPKEEAKEPEEPKDPLQDKESKLFDLNNLKSGQPNKLSGVGDFGDKPTGQPSTGLVGG